MKIIDDDIDNFTKIVEEDLLGESEDAPQIVGVTDDRPLELRLQDYTKSGRWKPAILNDDNSQSTNTNASTKSTRTDYNTNDDVSSDRKYESNQDSSPPRKHKKVNNNYTPVKITIGQNKEDDYSPPRRSRSVSVKEEDYSPPRRNKTNISYDQEGDMSPPRKSRRSDLSPPRKSKYEKDRNKNKLLEHEYSASKRERKSRWQSPNRNNSKSPQRADDKIHSEHKSSSKEHKYKTKIDNVPANRDETKKNKMTKTLDGKKAGLQNAHDLIKETVEFQKKEDELFSNMPVEVSGAHASTVMRDRKTGKKRNFEQEAQEKLEKKKKEEENKEKYSRWGKGLKQVEDQNEKLKEDLHEMSKPLARYADDEDLERFLKEQEREGDPMLAYIRKKKKKKMIEEGKPSKYG